MSVRLRGSWELGRHLSVVELARRAGSCCEVSEYPWSPKGYCVRHNGIFSETYFEN